MQSLLGVELPAAKRVETFETRDDWLERRRDFLTASDALTALGMSKYKSPYELWAEKTGKVEDEPAGLAARMGLALEPFIIEEYRKRTGEECQLIEPETGGVPALVVSERSPWLACTPDAVITGDKGLHGPPGFQRDSLLQLKSTGEFFAKEWENGEAPLGAQVQLLVEL